MANRATPRSWAVVRARARGLLGLAPAALLVVGVARFTLDHFFVRAPYLLDAGWLSAVVYRAGLIPDNPVIACDWTKSFYGVHFSPILSLFSLLSYVAPLPRIEWYAVVQALVYLPIGVSVHALWREGRRGPRLREQAAAAIAALAFSFSGLVFVFIGSPHYEAAIAGVVCLLLAAVVTNRPRVAWVWLVVAISIREDAGLHAALALAPVLILKRRGVEVGPSQRTLGALMIAAVLASVAEMIVQKTCFSTISMVRHVYLGDPPYAHLTATAVIERARRFLAERQLIYLPWLATAAIAVWRRDLGYLLGWVAALPWFLLNVTAVDPEKTAFNAYTAFPFLVSLYWIYVYGARLAPVSRRLPPVALEAVFAIVCASSTVGLVVASPSRLTSVAKAMALHRRMDRSAVHGFVAALGTHRDALGRLRVDPSVAAVALEWVRPEEMWHPGLVEIDALAFHRRSWLSAELSAQLLTSGLSACTAITGTMFMVCSREPLPAQVFAGVATTPISPVFAFGFREYADAKVEERGIVLRNRGVASCMLGVLPRGTYRLTFALDPRAGSGSPVATAEVLAEREILASAQVATGATDLAIRFEADGVSAVTCRLQSGAASELRVADARLVPISGRDGAAPAAIDATAPGQGR